MPSLATVQRLCALLLVASAVACGTQVSTGAVAPAPTTTPDGNPSGLVATWTVSSPDADKGDIVIIGDKVDGGLELFRDCGLMSGQWRANGDGLFVASEDGGDGSCFNGHADPWPRWMDAVGFSFDGNDAVLLSEAGAVLARLTPGGHPTTGPSDSEEFASPPAVTDDMRADFAAPASLPAGVEPATPGDVQGRWAPVDGTPAKAYVTFKADHSYAGSDGCNGVGGRYVIAEGGVILATSGPQTAVGCEMSKLADWVAAAGRLGLRDGRLVFVDPHGKVLGEGVRS